MLRLLKGNCQGGQNVCNQIHRENLANCQWAAETEQACSYYQAKFPQVASQQQSKGPANVPPEAASLHKCFYKGGEIVIDQHNVGSLTRNLCTSMAHCHSDVRQ